MASTSVSKERWHQHLFPKRDGSLLNLQRLFTCTKTVKEIITESPFAHDCALLAHTEEVPQHIINHFSGAAENFGLTISMKKTEVL